jgi:hypothetical protein
VEQVNGKRRGEAEHQSEWYPLVHTTAGIHILREPAPGYCLGIK